MQEFWLDVWDREVVKVPEFQQDSGAGRLADAVRKELTDADWNELFRWFRISKLEAIQTGPIEEIDTAEPPDSAGGAMIGFAEVFPWGHALDFVFDAELWTVDELYCVQPKCSCKAVVLRFLRYEDDLGKQIAENRNAPALRYDFKSQTVTAARGWPANAPDRSALMDTLKRAVPSLNGPWVVGTERNSEIRHCAEIICRPHRKHADAVNNLKMTGRVALDRILQSHELESNRRRGGGLRRIR